MDNPQIVMTAMVQGPGLGGNSATAVVAESLGAYLQHLPQILATGKVQTP
jgi:hypothetical protein